MKANKIEESKVYELKVSKNITTVKVVRIERRVNGQLAFVLLTVDETQGIQISLEFIALQN
jgi:hypothetical protein